MTTATTASHRPANGDVWRDTRGEPIHAHGGGVLHHEGVFYWYGEDKRGVTYRHSDKWQNYRVDATGVGGYRSTDLVNWEPMGLVLKADPAAKHHDLHPSQVLERPKVIFCEPTGLFVLWLHVEEPGYGKAATGVAVSDRPEGPFRYLCSMRPGGRDSRDQTLFVDDDGCAYHVCSTDDNTTTLVSRLDDAYTGFTGDSLDLFPGRYMEAQAVAKHGGRYWMIASGCTGWDPNPARSAVADSIRGPWQELGNPCRGPGADITFEAQSTFLLSVPGGGLLAMFDRWRKTDLPDSRYLWLPAEVDARSGELAIEHREHFDPADVLPATAST